MGRVRNIWEFLSQVWRDTDRIVRDVKPDVVIASSTYPMDIWVARRIARRAKAKLVFEVHDLWPLSPIELSGMSPRHPFARLCSRPSRDAYRDADVVVSMLPACTATWPRAASTSTSWPSCPTASRPTTGPTSRARCAGDVAGTLATARAVGETVVGYAGSMGEPNALDTLLDAAALLRIDPAGRSCASCWWATATCANTCRRACATRA